MNPIREKLIQRIEKLILKGEDALKHPASSSFIDSSTAISFNTASISFVENIYSKNHIYSASLYKLTGHTKVYAIRQQIEILKNIKDEIESGWDKKITSLVASEVFLNFWDMAKYLLEEGYKDPATVILGSILEGHLRQLCKEHDITIEFDKNGKKSFLAADQQNIELVKKEVYGTADQKQVTAWLDIRNKAAHGHYDKYSIEQVSLMADGLMGFISRTI